MNQEDKKLKTFRSSSIHPKIHSRRATNSKVTIPVLKTITIIVRVMIQLDMNEFKFYVQTPTCVKMKS